MLSLLTIKTEEVELFDSDKGEFYSEPSKTIRFEHSLKAIYDWEGIWKKSFIKGELSPEEWLSYYKLMALDPIEYVDLTPEVIRQIATYVSDPQTATVFSTHGTGQNGGNSGKTLTSEEIYDMMFAAKIPLEFETRNFNRLMTILRIHGTKRSEPKKMSKQDVMRQNKELNKMRKQNLQTKG